MSICIYIYIYMHMCTCGIWTEQTGFGSVSIVFFSHWRPYPWCWLWAGLIFPGTWMPYQNCQRHDWFSCALDKSGSWVAFSTSCRGWDCKLYGLPDFNHENPIVWQGLMQWVLLGKLEDQRCASKMFSYCGLAFETSCGGWSTMHVSLGLKPPSRQKFQ